MNQATLKMAVCCCLFMQATLAAAQTDDAAFYTSLYTSLCERNVHDTEALRSKLAEKKLPEFPAGQAARFLNGDQGHAYPVPHNGQMGNFVLSLPSGKNMCIVFARRLDVRTVQTLFDQIANHPPVGFAAAKQPDVDRETEHNGKSHTVSYVWTARGSAEKLLFMQTTTASDSANLQALTSVSVMAP